MGATIGQQRLVSENREFYGTGGRSEENAALGFVPAFLDCDTATVYRSCFADGRPAPMHLFDGLPAEVVASRAATGRILSVKASIVSGFILAGEFYTRDAAAALVGMLN